MKLTTNTILIIFSMLGLTLLACIPMTLLAMPLISARTTPEVDSIANIQAMITPTTVPPTATPLPPIPTVVPPTSTPIPTFTPVMYCDWAMFVKDVTVPDGSSFSSGDPFIKTWRLKNRGTCTWSPDYLLVFTGGEQMGGPTAIRLPSYVGPGQTVDVSINLTAPASSGHYVGYWILRNPAGVLFGAGDQADKAFYVDINTREQLAHDTVAGYICYPSEFNPPMTLYFERVGSSNVTQFYLPENHMTFNFLLPNGIYYVRAWAPGNNLEGAYMNPDRTMKTFVINGGQITSGIGICDWDVSPHSRGQ